MNILEETVFAVVALTVLHQEQEVSALLKARLWTDSKLGSQTPLVSAAGISGLAIASKARFTSLT